MKVAQSCPTPSNPMDCSLPGSSIHGSFPRQEDWSGVPLPSPSSETNNMKNPKIMLKTEVPNFTWLFTEILSLYTFICVWNCWVSKMYFKVSKVIVTDSEVTIEDAALKWRGFLKRHVEYSWSPGATTRGRKQEFLLSYPPNHYIWHICCSFFVCWLSDWMNEWTEDFDSIIACIQNTEYIQIILSTWGIRTSPNGIW